MSAPALLEVAEQTHVVPGKPVDWRGFVEPFVFTIVAVVAVALQFRFVTNVGGLWRDEVNSVNLATLPSFSEIWHFLEYDSFPMLFFCVLRAWTGIFGPENDVALRALGLITGLGILAALCANARAFGARWPVLSLALVGLNPMLVRYGDSTRAYGLGILLILLTMRSYWRLVQAPREQFVRRSVEAAIFALLSVQCVYYDSVLLLAISAGAVAVALRHRAWRTVLAVLAIGAVAAASLLPYVPMMIRMRGWTFMVYYPADFAWLWTCAGEVLGSPFRFMVWLWTGLFFGALALAASGSLRRNLSAAHLFAAVTMAVGVVSYATFLNALNYHTYAWYYITLVAFVACTMDVLLGAWWRRAALLRPIIAVALLCTTTHAAWNELPTRHTNVDILGAQLQRSTETGDIIVVPSWEYAIPLCRYYKGPAEIITLPPINDHRFHRYDLVLEAMKVEGAQSPVLTKLEDTLRSGHRVYLAGAMPFPRADETLPPFYALQRDAKGEWRGSGFDVWQHYAGRVLSAHGTEFRRVSIPVPLHQSVQEYEGLKAGVVAGWK